MAKTWLPDSPDTRSILDKAGISYTAVGEIGFTATRAGVRDTVTPMHYLRVDRWLNRRLERQLDKAAKCTAPIGQITPNCLPTVPAVLDTRSSLAIVGLGGNSSLR